MHSTFFSCGQALESLQTVSQRTTCTNFIQTLNSWTEQIYPQNVPSVYSISILQLRKQHSTGEVNDLELIFRQHCCCAAYLKNKRQINDFDLGLALDMYPSNVQNFVDNPNDLGTHGWFILEAGSGKKETFFTESFSLELLRDHNLFTEFLKKCE